MTPIDIARAFDLRKLDASFYADPYPVYDALRTHEPIKQMADGSLFLTRYRDLQAVYRDSKTFSSDKTVEFGAKYGTHTSLFAHHTTSLVFNDPPRHTRVRKLIAGALTARAIAAMEPGLVNLVDGLLDHAEARGEIDLIDDFASAIPVEVIGNLLDVPHDERGPLREWSLAILGALEPTLTEERETRGNRAVSDFIATLPPPPPVSDAADAARIERGRMLVKQDRCDFCHRPHLEGADNVPHIAGQREDYLLKSLREYKNNSRHGYDATMAEVLQPIPDQDLVDLAYTIARWK